MTVQKPHSAVSWSPRTFFSHRADTRGQIDRINANGGIAVDFRPMGSLAPAFAFEGAQSRSLSLWRTSSRTGFLTVPKLEADVITIRFVIEGAMVRRDHRQEHIGRSGRAMMVLFEAMRNEEASSNFEALTGTITRTALAAAHRALEGGDEATPLPRFVPVVDIVDLPLQALMHTMDRVFRQLKAGVHDADLLFPLLEEIMVYQLLTAWPRESADAVRGSASPTLRLLQRARDYIDSQISRKLLLSDVASAAGVGVRRLQAAFRTEIGKTPVQYILERRLDRVRADLQSASEDGVSVGAIAERWGFVHMSDFSRRYRARFGEAPSSTRRTRGSRARTTISSRP